MIPYLVRMQDITKKNIMLSQMTEENLQWFPFKRGRSIGSWELQAAQLKLGGWPANAARYSGVPKTSLGNEWVVK